MHTSTHMAYQDLIVKWLQANACLTQCVKLALRLGYIVIVIGETAQ